MFLEENREREIRYLSRYIVVGISGIFVNSGVLFSLTETRIFPYYISAVFALFVAFVSNYLLNDRWTFQDRGNGTSQARKFTQFTAIAIVGYIISYVLLLFFTEVLHVWYMLSNLGGIAVAFIWNYTMNRSVVWK